jgi:hypothetical protein
MTTKVKTLTLEENLREALLEIERARTTSPEDVRRSLRRAQDHINEAGNKTKREIDSQPLRGGAARQQKRLRNIGLGN